ncbi:MAG: energy transducer TonB [Flavobacteriales bacterium]
MQGPLKLESVVEASGVVSNAVALKDLGGGCTEEAIRMVRAIRWKPGIKDGRRVRTVVPVGDPVPSALNGHGYLRRMKERGPRKTLSEREVYSTPWISVSHHEAIDPSGAEGIYGVALPHLAVGVVPLDADGNTRIGPVPLPHRHLQLGASPRAAESATPPLDSAKRELREEA